MSEKQYTSISQYVPIPTICDKISVGDYVFASCWSDALPQDPWAVGIVGSIDDGHIEIIGQEGRWFKHGIHISLEIGAHIVAAYPVLEGHGASLHTVHNAVWDQFDLDNIPAYCLNSNNEIVLKGL